VPDKSSQAYGDALSAFQVGLAALEVGDDIRADTKLADLTRLAPGEPAGWGNWGVLALRQGQYDLSAERLARARDLAPKNAHAHALLGMLGSKRGQSAQAIADFRKAAELDPQDFRITYALAQEIERQGERDSDAEVQQLIQKILAGEPNNLAALLELARVSAKRGDAKTLDAALTKISAQSATWPPEAKEQLAALRAAASEGDLRTAATRTTRLRNVLMRVPEFRQSLLAIKPPPGEDVQPFTQLVRMESPVVKGAPADLAIKFDPKPAGDNDTAGWSWIGAIKLGSAGAPVLAKANGADVRLANGATLAFPGGPSKTAPSPEGILQIDFNYDFKTDLVLAGAGGVRLFRQENPTTFIDVTSQTKLPNAALAGIYTGAWAADVETDGDLDIVLGASEGVPDVLRNNGDGTFVVIHPFTGISGLRQFAWADLDGDATPDAAIVDGAGKLHIFINERLGQFRERALPAVADVKAIAVADADAAGRLGVFAVRADGVIVRISTRNQGASWEVVDVARARNAADVAGDVRLHVADLDNNGASDLVLGRVSTNALPDGAGALIWLGSDNGAFTPLEHPAGPAMVFDAAALSGGGKLDLLGLSGDGRGIRAENQGTRNYHWQIVRPRAAQAFGDQRINPFGVGGEVEIRTGALVQKKPITGPQVRFGLGEQTGVDVIRVIWPSGVVQAEFDAKADQDVITEQRLKGSCPFLFAYNGKEMAFVKDAVPWGSAIGLRINTIGTARIAATEEWYKVGRDQLVPREGYYDLRFTAELWEVYYYDQLALMTVDHPAGTEIFVDERFVIPPVKLGITAVATPRPIAKATDDTGRDVTKILATLDNEAVDSFGRGQYQGVTRDHYVEIDLGDHVPADGPLYLIAHGSLHPTDSSINVALAQGERWHPRGLSLEVEDGHGGWTVANDNLGFPAGRVKTILIDLSHAFRAGAPHRLRLKTNLEIYWDKIEWARGLPETALKTARLDPAVADLHYRGYSVITTPAAGTPEIPRYQQLAGTRQRWRDLTGYYTRFGDVRELLQAADDRYVIMNAGDEMSLRFPEQPPPAEGWVRDFVIVGDGWIKDGDYNSTFSSTVLPLPHHGERDYTTAPGRLEDEWTYRQHPDDWQNYHTRYVTPEAVMNAMRNDAGR